MLFNSYGFLLAFLPLVLLGWWALPSPRLRLGFLTLARLQRELEARLGRRVDVVPRQGLKPLIRDVVLASSRVLYAA